MAAPYMPFYIADYLADTVHLDRSEHGAYLLLLMAMWRAGGKLPRNDQKLAKLAKCTPAEWAQIKGTILDFFVIRGGTIEHKRMSKEMAKYENKIQSAKLGGIATASKKANKNNEKMQNSLPSESQLTRTITRTNTIDKSIVNTPIVPINSQAIVGEIITPFDDFWKAYPRKIAKTIARKSYDKATKSGANHQSIMEGLKRSMSSWSDPKFIPHPATWLNHERWNDEPIDNLRTRENQGRPVNHWLSAIENIEQRTNAGID